MLVDPGNESYNPSCNALKCAVNFNGQAIAVVVSAKMYIYLERNLDLLVLGRNVSIKNHKPSRLGLKKVFLMINTALICQ